MTHFKLKPDGRPLAHRISARGIGIALCVAFLLHAPICRAEGDENLAMPGLWKADTRVVHGSHVAKPKVKWHCLLDDDDPKVMFPSQLMLPGAACHATNVTSTDKGLSWEISCPGRAGATAHIEFDSNEHFTGSIDSKAGHETTQVEGQHRAACTDPSD